MKKIGFVLWALIALSSCNNDVQFNTPAFQANKDYTLWKASSFDAIHADDGSLTITASRGREKMVIMLSSLQVATYILAETNVSKIDYVDVENVLYSTSHLSNSEANVYPGSGKVIITKIEGNTITGSFRCIAFTADGLKSVGFNEGLFYNLPVR